ncbi:chemotaxis protein CheW [Shewanella woodyi]|uniref:chemotaxis protein CheW n=1 Tax=Shewanella woodyi TaxID=60961 RepID=UPI0007EB882C|nr:chemotaxis protein CheW [Shewanella woodyi]
MSNSVDDAVLDYFSLLLEDDESGANTGLPVEAAKSQKPVQIVQKEIKSPVVKINAQEEKSDLADIDKFEALKKSVCEEALQIQKQAKLKAESFVNTKEQDPHLNKLALEQLLEPLFKPELKEATQEKVKDVAVVKTDSKLKSTSEAKKVKPEVQEQVLDEQKQAVETKLETKTGEIPPKVTKDLLETLDDEFQVLFFKVAGLTLAVPLVSLGGIVKLDRLNHIMGRPSWYKGVQTHRDSQLNVVDTCAWVMPEKYDDALAESVNYQYVVLLEDSNWGLTCESLVNSVKIMKSDVNWRSRSGKRPWLAGVVKEQMCGILHVHSLIELLNSGLGSQDPVG